MRLVGIGLSLALLVSVGCGDDDGGSADTGAGTDGGGGVDTGVDTGTPVDTGVDAGFDAGEDAGVRDECDPFAEPSGCGDGLKCNVVLDIDEEGGVTDVFFGCIDDSSRVGAGVPCSLSVDATPDDDTDDVRGDTCDEGLFCTRFGNDPGDSFLRCKTMCDGETTECGERSYCLGLNGDPFFGTCIESDGCDPVAQDCTGDRACYVFGSTAGNVVGDCYEVDPMDGSDGAIGSACEFFDQCAPGGRCTQVSETAAECFAFCEAMPAMDGGVADAGADAAVADAGADAGTPPMGCTAPDECIALEPDEGGSVLTPTPVGICAEPTPDP
ncbi:MAG: hypothetical protein AAGE52_36255 [Myxococcota bacterium]